MSTQGITYELALALKNAGFPKKIEFINGDSGKEMLVYPTLSELIEACGYEFVAVGKESPNKWRASTIKYSGYGETPEIAVANLWLELNKK